MKEQIYMKKEIFVFKLSMALKDIGIQARYKMMDDGEEFVELTYSDGYKKDVCVSADSLTAILKDVAKAIE